MSSKSTFSNSTSQSYALALYELSKENSELDMVANEMKSLGELIRNNSEFKNTILNPTISKDEKGNVISLIAKNNNFSTTLIKFLGFISTKNRLFFLEKITESFLNLFSKNRGELKAKLISAKKLSSEEQKKIQEELTKDFSSKLNVDYKHDPDLIAGLIIQIGSVMVDTSIKTKLKKLTKNMIEA